MNENQFLVLKQIRADLHELAFIADRNLESSRPLSLAKTALEESAMFTGTTIKECNYGKTPYTESENPSTLKIEPMHVDEVNILIVPEEWAKWEYVQKVKWMRYMLSEIENKFKAFITLNTIPAWAYNPLVFAHMNTVRAKHWFGMELGRIRDSKHENG